MALFECVDSLRASSVDGGWSACVRAVKCVTNVSTTFENEFAVWVVNWVDGVGGDDPDATNVSGMKLGDIHIQMNSSSTSTNASVASKQRVHICTILNVGLRIGVI